MRVGPPRAILRKEVRAMAIVPEKYLDLLQRKKAFANLATVMPDGSPQVTPVWCDYKDGLVRVNTAKGRVKARNLKKGAAVALCDRRSRQSVPLCPDPWPRPARHGRRRGGAHRFARKEVPRAGQVYECRARRSPPDVRNRAHIRVRNGLSGVRYSGLILPSTITFFHFSYSARVKAAACSGVVPRGVTPILAKAAFSSGRCSTLLISPLSFASTVGGSPAGA